MCVRLNLKQNTKEHYFDKRGERPRSKQNIDDLKCTEDTYMMEFFEEKSHYYRSIETERIAQDNRYNSITQSFDA